MRASKDIPASVSAQQGSPGHQESAQRLVAPGHGIDVYHAFIRDMHEGMSRMMTDMHAAPPSGNPDIDFLLMMIPHHAGAVEMARLVLRDGHDPLVREIASKIIAGQMTEIEGMEGRLRALRAGEQDYPMLGGNRGQ